MMKQAQKMQNDIARVQEELKQMEVEGTSGGGMIKITANGAQEILSISINPEVVDADDVEMLEDLILAAIKEAVGTAQELAANEMSKVTGGINMPGLF